MQTTPSSTVLEKATGLAASGALAEAIVLLKQTIKDTPQLYPAWLLLSQCLFKAGFFEEAAQVGQAAEPFDPLQEDFRAIQASMQKQAVAEAAQTAETMLVKQPGHPRAIFTLAHLAMNRGDPDTSLKVLEEGLRTSPANLTLRQLSVDCQMAVGDFAGAIETARLMVSIDESFDTQWTLATVLLRLGQHEELLTVCERAVSLLDSDTAKRSQIDKVRGQALRVLGRREESVAALHASLKANPGNADAWWALADMKNYRFSERELDQLRELKELPQAPPHVRSVFSFTYAKAVEHASGMAAAMPEYEQANKLQQRPTFNRGNVSRDFKAIATAYSAHALSQQANSLSDQPVPIFIVGLPRSGSTLIEQILASHSQIQGTLEQPTLACIERTAHAACMRRYGSSLLSSLDRLTAEELSMMGQAYIDKGALFRATDQPFFTDKLPFNFRSVGLIHKILPQAVIVDIRRNAMDCGLSLYKQYFTTGVDFSYDLADIATFYKDYLQLMSHWDVVLPGKVLRIEYEALVNDPEPVIRRLLAHVGVEFESACLTPHETRRSVHTASSEQVREPISASGIGLSSQVATALEPLRAGLELDSSANN